MESFGTSLSNKFNSRLGFLQQTKKDDEDKMDLFRLHCIKSSKTCKVFNPDDSRFLNYRKPGPNDSRSPCPALNALANHGFLPHDGKNLGIGQIVIFILTFGYASSKKPLCFTLDLADLASHRMAIEHDCSFSRDDWKNGTGNNRDFNPELWKVAYDELRRSYGGSSSAQRTHINFITMGRVKSVRAKDAIRRNPDSQWDPRAWFNGFTEHGLVLSAFSDNIPGFARLCVIKTLFEEERLPWKEGWRPRKFRLNLVSMVTIGTLSIIGDRNAFTTMWNVLKGEPTWK
ncbi:peroxidase, family 2 domain-containing protein [Hirsutella rhossiliensis]